jgi:hypothetical protein
VGSEDWRLSARRLRLWLLGLGGLAQATEEQCLIDPTVEDRDTHLDALDDHVPSFQTGLSCKLGGRQVICHRSSSSFAAYISNSMPGWTDGLNVFGHFCLLKANFETPFEDRR